MARLGSFRMDSRSPYEQHIPISDIITHPDLSGLYMFRLQTSVRMGYAVRPACLAGSEDLLSLSPQPCRVVGWSLNRGADGMCLDIFIYLYI